jgi:two-component system sensor histidine kinase KdpD
MTDTTDFARLVSLACHDLRTPLATVYGFARTLARTEEIGDPAARYVAMIEAASQQMTELLDELGLAARIEAGRYDPVLQQRDTLELARAAAEHAGDVVTVSGGPGEIVDVDAPSFERALAGLALAAQRHGGVESVDIAVAGREFRIGPVEPAAGPVVLAQELKDLGAAVALRLGAANGGTAQLDGRALVVTL